MNFAWKRFVTDLFSNKGYVPALMILGIQFLMFIGIGGFAVAWLLGNGLSFRMIETDPGQLLTFVPFIIGAFVLALAIGIYSQAAMIGSFVDVVKLGKFQGFKSFFKNGLRYFWRLVAFSLLMTVLIMVLLIPLGLLFLFGGFMFGSQGPGMEPAINFVFTVLTYLVIALSSPLIYIAFYEKQNVWKNYFSFLKKKWLVLLIVGLIVGVLAGIPLIGMIFQFVFLLPMPLYLLVLYDESKENYQTEEEEGSSLV
ncbi:hypothetical protein [Halobacillus yeomjeoni]|uniref:Uncharacterized protein n=1 Tax=Halobacillus yeomjeoni TaxID=311194 RepID=A0A931MWG8_9BACI|nr:hypothetical protein [Halobacillus yeomjeoni]MBH0231344.1 hypothetical protein [Halobacillus yeomjeoni]